MTGRRKQQAGRVVHIVVVTHEFDEFVRREGFWRKRDSMYLLFDVLNALRGFGHRWSVARGPRPVRGDVAILHVDATRIPDEYLALADAYGVTVNFAVRDISKRVISGARLAAGEPWSGSVIVKSDLNCMGLPEDRLNAIARAKGRREPFPGHRMFKDYLILSSVEEVPDEVWADPRRVVERFLPERDEEGFALRTWVFMGEKERCTRHVSTHRIVKAAGMVRRTPCEVPDAIRAERERLGFDYGKFDFVVHDGTPVLLDTNRTPGTSPELRAFLQDGARNLAAGLDALIRCRMGR